MRALLGWPTKTAPNPQVWSLPLEILQKGFTRYGVGQGEGASSGSLWLAGALVGGGKERERLLLGRPSSTGPAHAHADPRMILLLVLLLALPVPVLVLVLALVRCWC